MDLHPLTVEIYKDPEFFNKSHENLSCLYCSFSCDRGPVISIPLLHQDAKLGSANPRDSIQCNFQVVHTHKIYCDVHCAKSCVKNVPLWNWMLIKFYQIYKPLEIRQALPPWTLRKFGGSLSKEQYHSFKQIGYKALEPLLILSEEEKQSCEKSKITEYRIVITHLQDSQYSPYYKIPYENLKNNRFWYEPCVNEELCCYNDQQPLKGLCPCSSVKEYDTNLKKPINFSLMFCSLQCVLSYITKTEGQLQYQKSLWNHQTYSELFENSSVLVANRACSKRLLKVFGGILSIEEFRNFHHPQVYSTVLGPPHRDFPCFALLNNIDLYLTRQNDATPRQVEVYSLQYDTQYFDVISLVESETKEFIKKFHTISQDTIRTISQNSNLVLVPNTFHNNPDDFRLHYAILIMERQTIKISNQDIIEEMTKDTRVVI